MRALVLAIGVALLPAVAFAKSRVAVAPFEGDNGGVIQDIVAEALENDYTIEGPSQVRRTLDKLGLDTDLTEKDLKKLANELEAEAIVRGDVTSKNGHKVLHVRLFVNGKRVHGFKIEFASTKSEKMKQALKDKLLEKIGGEDKPKKKGDDEGDTGATGADAKPDKTDKPDKGDKGDDATDADAKPDTAEGKKKKGDDDEGDDKPKKKKRVAAADDEDEVSAGVEVHAGGTMNPHTANRAAIRVDFGPSASRRTLVFTSRAFDQAPKPYENSIVPGGRVGGDLYPLAFSNPDSVAAGLGIGGDFDQTIGLKLRSTAQLGTQFPVVQKHWSVGARFRLAFGRKASSPTVTFRGGIFHRMFEVDRSALMPGNVIDLPDVFYKGFNPGADMRFPIGPVALILGGEAFLVTDAGEIQKPNQYGQARVTGGQGYAGLDISITKRIAARLVGEFAQMGFAFTGNGEMTNNRDGVPTSKDIGGAADRYIGGALTIGVMY